MEGELSVKIVGLNEIYLAVHDGGDNKIDEGTLKKEHGESTTNVIENPGQPEEHTAEGVRLQLVFHDSGGDGYTDDFVAEIESFLLEAPLDAICSGSIFYLTMNGDEVAEYNTIRNSTERAVRSASQKIVNKERKEKVVNILLEMESGYNTIVGLKALKALNITQETPPDYTQEEIAQNIRILKMKLSSPMTDADVNLYGALKESIDEDLDISELTWRDPVASTVLSDELNIVKNLKPRQKRTFMEPRENMKCEVPELIFSRVDEFVENFNNTDTPNYIRNIIHNKSWKENEVELLKTTERILGVLSDIWRNPAFSTNTARSMQSEGTYITDAIMPLLRASLGDLPNGHICLSSAERQSLASKARRNNGTGQAVSHPPRNTYQSPTVSSP
ncbi:2778_t:CDS:2 [Entrophospora sp. SA101]|nr:2778_t:CDS:2 [Entrophospora sp. SA101]